MKTEKTKVYDWPTRLFHWSFAGLFVGAFLIAKTVDDEAAAYPYHMLLGLVLALTVVLRIIWGFIGTKYARFSSFALRPTQLLQYFRALLLGRTERKLGHNPASSWAALVMMALALGLAVTGYLMTTGDNKELLEEVHELFANAFLVVAIAHVAGVLLHMIRHRDGIAMSMIHGAKTPISGETGIARSRVRAGFVFIGILVLFALNLSSDYDADKRSLKLFGSTLQLGEIHEEVHD